MRAAGRLLAVLAVGLAALARGASLKEEIANRLAEGDGQEGGNEQETLLAQGNRMSFDCWQRTHDDCESQYCLWKGDKCVVSPAAYHELCAFYCESSICIAPTAGGPPGCVAKPKFLQGLCDGIKTRANCINQEGYCAWRNSDCKDASTCCVKAADYCKASNNKQKQITLNKFLKSCSAMSPADTICTGFYQACKAA